MANEPTTPPEPLTDQEKLLVNAKIDIHGFYNAMLERTHQVRNPEFCRLKENYLNAFETLTKFIYGED